MMKDLNHAKKKDMDYKNDHSPEKKNGSFLFSYKRLDSNGRIRTKE